jgi:hypothetical protein
MNKKLSFLLLLVLTTVFTSSISAQRKGTTTYYGNVWIKNFVGVTTPTDNMSVVGDGYNDVLYKDKAAPTSTGDCVSAFGSPSFLMYPQASGCTTATPRNFWLYISAYRMYFSNLYGTTSRKVDKVLTDARFGFYCGAEAYSIQPDGMFEPSMLSADGRKRRISNFGASAFSANLLKPQDGGFISLNIPSFSFPFDITTEFTTQ